MNKSMFAGICLLMGSLASGLSISVIVPYEEEETPAPKKELSAEQKKQEADFQERLRQRDAEREKAKEAQEKFRRELQEQRQNGQKD